MKKQSQSQLREIELELMRTLFEQDPMFVGVTKGPEHRLSLVLNRARLGFWEFDIDRLSSLVNKLLDLSRLQQDCLMLDKQLFSLDTLIEEKVDMLQSISPHDIEVRGTRH